MKTESLGDAYPKEQARLRELLTEYEAIGPVGAFGLAVIKDVLRRADEAAISGDLVVMIRLYHEMKEYQ